MRSPSLCWARICWARILALAKLTIRVINQVINHLIDHLIDHYKFLLIENVRLSDLKQREGLEASALKPQIRCDRPLISKSDRILKLTHYH
ncbi:MAG: hypothetical protein HC781_13935 [Leptolyngbyaceae cyanobacterium CSU_1_4]|nr:hypothetical protein [Leptolyngbyaceae cyanobacterium CSU_1_4]